MTDVDPRFRRLLPFLQPTVRHGSRSSVTCRYRCGNACDAQITNRTNNPSFAEVVPSS